MGLSKNPERTAQLIRLKKKERDKDPKVRAACAEYARRSWADPECRKRRSENISRSMKRSMTPARKKEISLLRKGKTMKTIHGDKWREIYRKRYGFYPEEYDPDVNSRGDWAYREKLWSQLVKNRDDYACQECGSRSYVESHHIKPWSTHPELRFKVSNGITLCLTHHYKRHRRKVTAKVVDLADKRSRSPVPLGGNPEKGY